MGEIGPGILTFLGIAHSDTEKELQWLIQKILKLRIFEDERCKMNLSLLDLQGSNPGAQSHSHLIVSQFTLYGDTAKGNRPSFVNAASPAIAQPLYEKALELSKASGVKTQGGIFQADMKVTLINDGPVTFVIESE